MSYTAVIFDFDGTVADTSQGVFNGIHYALKSIGKDETDSEVLSTYIGPPLFNTLRRYCDSDDEAQELMTTYREYYSTTGLFEAFVYPGIAEALKRLHESSIKIAVASAKPQVFVEKLLEYFNISQYFDFVRGIRLEDKSPDKADAINAALAALGVSAENALMVGDRCFDIDGANKAGTDSAGVLFGFGSREEFERSGATYIVAEASEICDIVLKKCL